jgi:hypothetical protein
MIMRTSGAVRLKPPNPTTIREYFFEPGNEGLFEGVLKSI